MALYNFHRLLIAAAVLFFAGFTVYSFRHLADGKALGISAAALTLVGVLYFIYFNIRLRTLRARGDIR